MPITLTVFAHSPDRGVGLARDMPVRWALEEAGLPYETRALPMDELRTPTHLARQPFAQIPAYEDGMVTLFESGAIVLHLAEAHDLLPADPAARAGARAWLFAALSTVEPPIIEWQNAVILERHEPWHAARIPILRARIDARLRDLAAALADADWLAGPFSAADIMMASVLRRLVRGGLLAPHPALAAYVARAEARPAFCRAYAAQRALFEDGA